MRALPFSLLPVLVVACERQPVALDRVGSPRFAATHSETTGFVEEINGPADCTANPRIGEIVLFTGRINYVLTAITTPSGNVDTTLKLRYDPAIRLVGATSGTVWMIDTINTRPIFILRVHGDGSVTKDSEREFYRSEAGANLMLHVNFLVTVNANGAVTASRDFIYQCVGG